MKTICVVFIAKCEDIPVMVVTNLEVPLGLRQGDESVSRLSIESRLGDRPQGLLCAPCDARTGAKTEE